MAGPIITGVVFLLAVIVISVLKPNAGRIALGFFFLAMGLGVNTAFLATHPQFVTDYGADSWLPLYSTLTRIVIAPNAGLFTSSSSKQRWVSSC